jgi:sterol 14-demethylase
MGVLELIKETVAEVVAQRGLGLVLGAAFVVFLALSVVLNVLNQVLFKNPNEPPVVFHWLPIIGSTITYGIDPYKFFFECRAKVCPQQRCVARIGAKNKADKCIVWRHLHVYPLREEDDSVSGQAGERIHPQREAAGCQCRGDLHCVDHASFW